MGTTGSTAAFSTDYVDKSFRWSYSGRGRSYDYEGFNRAPGLDGQGASFGTALASDRRDARRLPEAVHSGT